MIPSRLFDRLFGQREEGWLKRKRSILDAVLADASALKKKLPTDDQARVTTHMPTAGRQARTVWTAKGSCATSIAGTLRSLRIWSGS